MGRFAQGRLGIMRPTMTDSSCVLVTGAARRLGAVIARTLHQADYRVIVHYHQSQAEADALVADLNAVRPDSAVALAADLADPAQITVLAEQALAQWGRLDAVVHNASTFIKLSCDEGPLSDWSRLFDVNAKAPFLLNRALLPALRKARGCIVHITDAALANPRLHYDAYYMSKAALASLTQSLARAEAPMVRVNSVAPGVTLLPEGDNALSEEQLDAVKVANLMQTTVPPEEVAAAVLHLLHSTFISSLEMPLA